jgi:hypothetical protein
MGADSYEDVRRGLERELRERVDPRIWAYLVKKRFVAEVEQGVMTITTLAKEYRELRDIKRAGPVPSPTEPRRELPPNDYLGLLSRALAEAIDADPMVAAFRDAHLNGETIAWDRFDPWVRACARREAPPTTYMEAPVDQNERPLRSASRRLSTRFLEYVVPPSTVMRVPTARGGVLDRLRVISEHLASPGGWPPAAVSTFVATGKPYLVPRVIVTRVLVAGLGESRVRLDVHPTVNPDELRHVYAGERKGFKIPNPRRGKRSKTALVEFVEAHQSLTWKELMNEWNRTYPDASYTRDNNMVRDYHRALDLAGVGGE